MDKTRNKKRWPLRGRGLHHPSEGSYWGTAVDDESTHEGHLEVGPQDADEEGIRDEMTLLASGGIAMAEHVAKAMLCGADAVVIDFPILMPWNGRMCRDVSQGSPACGDRKGDAVWVLRGSTISSAFHNQLLEVMGAWAYGCPAPQGRSGRAMFFEEMDKPVFGTLGEVKEGMNLSNHKVLSCENAVAIPKSDRKYRLSRSKECTACGKCVESCLYGPRNEEAACSPEMPTGAWGQTARPLAQRSARRRRFP